MANYLAYISLLHCYYNFHRCYQFIRKHLFLFHTYRWEHFKRTKIIILIKHNLSFARNRLTAFFLSRPRVRFLRTKPLHTFNYTHTHIFVRVHYLFYINSYIPLWKNRFTHQNTFKIPTRGLPRGKSKWYTFSSRINYHFWCVICNYFNFY